MITVSMRKNRLTDVESAVIGVRQAYEKILKQKRKAQMKKEEEIERNWKFTLSNPAMLCNSEISKYVTRKNPIALIRVNAQGSDSKLNVMFHSSIVKKAGFLENFPFKVESVSKEVYLAKNVPCKESDVVKWAKDIKNKSWGNQYESTKVVVGIPKI